VARIPRRPTRRHLTLNSWPRFPFFVRTTTPAGCSAATLADAVFFLFWTRGVVGPRLDLQARSAIQTTRRKPEASCERHLGCVNLAADMVPEKVNPTRPRTRFLSLRGVHVWSTHGPVAAGSLGSLLGASWRPLGDLLGPLGGFCWGLLGPLGAPSEAVLGGLSGPLGALLGKDFGILGGSFGSFLALGAILRHLALY